MTLCTICFISVVILCVTNAELFTSTADMEYLVKTQKIMIDELVHMKADKHFGMKEYLDVLKREHEAAMEDIPEYIGNPINAFKLIKRMTIDLSHFNDTLIGAECLKKIRMKYENITIPTLEDLTGAVLGLVRLQEVYRLNINDLAEGRLNGAYCSPMTASDCYEIGQILYKKANYITAQAWLIQTFKKFNEEQPVYPFSDRHVLEYVNLSGANQGKRVILNYKSQEVYQKMIVARLFSFNSLLNSIVYVRRAFPYLLTPVKYCISMMVIIARVKFLGTLRTVEEADGEPKDYDSMCRGELVVPPEISNRLTCRYLSEYHAYSKIAPFKTEMLYLDPDVTLFYNVLSDHEIELIKQTVRPYIRRSNVLNKDMRTLSDIRLSKSGALLDTDFIGIRLSRRLTHMTGLVMDTSENLSVINYGIGGYYASHYDFSPTRKRLATMLFYLSDVAQGGATVFPNFGLTVFPVKGSAILWSNLHNSGAGNTAMLHSSCPVLQGSKWVMTKWINSVGQEFIRPCTLDQGDESDDRVYPKAVPRSTRM